MHTGASLEAAPHGARLALTLLRLMALTVLGPKILHVIERKFFNIRHAWVFDIVDLAEDVDLQQRIRPQILLLALE
jgi:hypothetical protein